MAMVSSDGLMAHSTREIGVLEKPMVKGSCTMPTVTFMKEIGSKIKQTAKELTHTLMEPNMWVTGKMINSMGSDLRHGLMAQSMKVNTKKERSMVLESLHSLMDLCIRANSI